jgi:glycosyltransferase involved in cell wall biosynthesis
MENYYTHPIGGCVVDARNYERALWALSSIQSNYDVVSARQAMFAKELTILMPCLNEAETIASCVGKALGFLKRSGIDGEVLVADNGSTDGSQEIARALGARVVAIAQKGYGAALIGGIKVAQGRYIIMGDADDSYDFSQLERFIEALRGGVDVVIGNRFKGGIAAGAMPFLHRYLGNPVLSFLGRLFFKSGVGDFHCGLRGFNSDRIRSLRLITTGMEFASEMVVRSSLAGYRIEEVPITFSPDGRSRRPHLRTWRDGWRHLRFLLIYSPKWLFLYPGFTLILAGLIGATMLMPGKVIIAQGVELDVHTFLVAAICVLLGLQSVTFAIIARRYATRLGLIPPSLRYGDILEWLTLERMLLIGLMLALSGVGGFVWSLFAWAGTGFGPLDYPMVMRVLIASMTAIAAAVQLALSAFLMTILDIDLNFSSGQGGSSARGLTEAPAETPPYAPASAPVPTPGVGANTAHPKATLLC